jgi:SAM-dependent methyltransferase
MPAQPICIAGAANQQTRDQWVEKALRDLPAGWRILDSGAGEQPYRRFCEHLDYVAQDFAQYDGTGDAVGLHPGTWAVDVDIVSDITTIPEPDASFDAVLCTEVLEHVPDPVPVIREFARLIRPGGLLVLTAPFCSLTHQAPYHFSTGLSRYWYEMHLPAAGFRIEEATPNGNYFEYLAQEQRRVASVAERYRAGAPTVIERVAMATVLRMLTRFSRRDRGSWELLTLGWHIKAARE